MTSRVVSHYGELINAIKGRVDEFGITYAVVDDLAGLQDNYFAKLVTTPPMKRMSIFTLFLVLQALGLKMTLNEDAEALERIKARLIKRKHRKAFRMRAAPRMLQFGPDQLKQMRSRGGSNRAARMTPAERAASARHAATVRWRKLEMTKVGTPEFVNGPNRSAASAT